MITKSELAMYAGNKKDFHVFLVRNDFFMPHEKNKEPTLVFICEIFRENARLSRQTEVNGR